MCELHSIFKQLIFIHYKRILFYLVIFFYFPQKNGYLIDVFVCMCDENSKKKNTLYLQFDNKMSPIHNNILRSTFKIYLIIDLATVRNKTQKNGHFQNEKEHTKIPFSSTYLFESTRKYDNLFYSLLFFSSFFFVQFRSIK